MVGDDRERGLKSEVRYWDRVLASGGVHPAQFQAKLDPDTRLDERLVPFLPEGSDTVRILDVGSGPLTVIGKKTPGRTLEIVATDPLADAYNELMARHSIVPPVAPVAVEVETLSDVWPDGSFHLVHAQNCLDHAANPMQGIREMCKVVREGCFVVLYHARDEAERQSYKGLHKWNLRSEGDRFLLTNREQTIDVLDDLGADRFEVTIKLFREPMFQVAIRRL